MTTTFKSGNDFSKNSLASSALFPTRSGQGPLDSASGTYSTVPTKSSCGPSKQRSERIVSLRSNVSPSSDFFYSLACSWRDHEETPRGSTFRTAEASFSSRVTHRHYGSGNERDEERHESGEDQCAIGTTCHVLASRTQSSASLRHVSCFTVVGLTVDFHNQLSPTSQHEGDTSLVDRTKHGNWIGPGCLLTRFDRLPTPNRVGRDPTFAYRDFVPQISKRRMCVRYLVGFSRKISIGRGSQEAMEGLRRQFAPTNRTRKLHIARRMIVWKA